MKGGAWKRMGRVNGSDAGAKAKPVWLCRGCGLWHHMAYDSRLQKLAKPAACISCGRMDFDHYHSTGEAKRYATLELLQKAGEISELKRQVPLSLMTIGPKGLPCEWGKMVVDHAYVESGVQIYEDFKPSEGPSPDAALKIRCLEAQGYIIRIVTEKGYV